MMASESQKSQDYLTTFPKLAVLNPKEPHTFIKPVKRINEGYDVPHFLMSKAYGDIGTFVMQLNRAMCPRRLSTTGDIQTWQLGSAIDIPAPVKKLQQLLQSIDALIEEAPPDTGPRRFGNVSFRKWFEILESRVDDLLKMYLPSEVLDFKHPSEDPVSVFDELTPYLLGSFGSSQRLDFGTGHELSFLAFLGCLWKLGGFAIEESQDGPLERSLVLGVIEPYLRVVRRLILTYTLEPAGSHGVWGLDDHFFLSYIFGSSQYSPAITENEAIPIDGSLPGSPNPGDIVKKSIVDEERSHNMYFSAVGFINDVKTGPFWEHSPILFDISGVRSGWGKINKGMIKMYNAEVLSKFPVVQHFPFGSLFSWKIDPSAIPAPNSTHISSQPLTYSSTPAATRPSRSEGIGQMPATVAPWGKAPVAGHGTETVTARAPWPNRDQSRERQAHGQQQEAGKDPAQGSEFDVVTKAPWAR